MRRRSSGVRCGGRGAGATATMVTAAVSFVFGLRTGRSHASKRRRTSSRPRTERLASCYIDCALSPRARTRNRAAMAERKKKRVVVDGRKKRAPPPPSRDLLLRELEVHREELRAQNEELRQTNAALVAAKERSA